MWEAFGKIPVWLQAILIIVPMGVLATLGIVIAIKILKSDKVKAGKDGIELDDPDDKVPDKIEPAATNEVKP
jgi:hypothetical protein